MAFSRKKGTSKRNHLKSNSLPVAPAPPIPEHFRCPISLDLMKDPVTAPTGITYDRQSIERWLDMGNATCPVTNTTLHAENLIPNHTIRRMIQNWCVENSSHGIERVPTPRIPLTPREASEILSSISSAAHLRDGERFLELTRKVKSLAKESERNRCCLVSNGAPSVLAYAFRVSAGETLEVSAEALAAMVALLPFDDEVAVSESGSSESLDSLARILKYGDIGSRLDAVLIVNKVAASSRVFAKAVVENRTIVEALAEHVVKPISTQATKASLVATFYLLSSEEAVATEFVNLGVILPILEILVDSDKSMVEKALAVFNGLLNCEEGREVACRNALTIPVVAKKMLRVSEMATEFAVSALWKLCKSCGAECLQECLQVGVFQKLLLLLQVGCRDQCKERATEMLKLMSGFGEKLECVDTVDFRGLNRSL
ncbi:hypothetical protein HPP92_028487 [Vanilla planifolia]|uniref:U-box domain-containing protein n=2 Tax=Vanilla planifolia TaxID=51239 RepID=A0A835U445_VANPL|nr:hypothetical protein HPP92_028487 [Vanilla planifolia]